ncbi:unnamed protein product, partial [Staurois parvus]
NSVREIFLLLNIPWSTVSGSKTKWKQLETTATQPQSGRPCKMTEQGQRMLKYTVRRSHQLSAESIGKDLQALYGLQSASWNGFPCSSSCFKVLHHQVQCKASDAVV